MIAANGSFTPLPLAPRVQAPARAAGDALAGGLAAAHPDAFRTALIRLAGEARDAEALVGRARARFERDEIGAPELRAAEAGLARAYDRLRTLRASAEGAKGLGWKARYGFDLAAVWAQHGVALPVAPKRVEDGPGRSRTRQVVGAIAGVGGLFGFAVFARAANRTLAALGFGGFVLGALISGGLMLIDANRR